VKSESAERIFDALPIPDADGYAFSTQSLGGTHLTRIGKSPSGSPAFLVSVTDASMAPIQLRNIRALFNARCRLSVGGRPTEESLTVVECTTGDFEVQRLFLRGLEPIIASIGDSPSAARAREVVEDLIELFRHLGRPATRSVVGAWGELLFLVSATRPAELLKAWHVDPSERFDFLHGSLRIEVKTSRSGRREHAVSLEQLNDPGARVALASIQTQGAGGGASVRELLDTLLARLDNDPEAQLRAMQGLASCLGSEWSEALDVRFDRELAEQTMDLFDAEAIPTIPGPIPAEITSVRFVVDITGCSPMKKADLDDAGGIWAAAMGS
jgi:hypothetical protein